MPRGEWIASDVRTQLIRPHTGLHLVGAGLQELPGLQADPDLQHTRIPLPHTPQQTRAPTLRAQLAQDRQRALEQVQIRIQTPADALEQQDADDHVDEVALHADMVAAHHAQHLVQHIADLDVAEGEGAGFDAEDEMLHPEREDLAVDHRFGLAAPLHHQVARPVAVELGNRLEEVEEVGPVRAVERRHQARVDEDELRAVPLRVDAGELVGPRGAVVPVRAEAREDFLGDVFGVGGRGGGLLVAAQAEVDLLGLVEAHHDVARVEVGVDEVVDQQHVQEGVEPFVRDLLLEHAAAVFEEGGERDPRGEFLDQDLPGGVLGVGEGEPGGGAVLEVLAEHGQVGGFDPEVELQAHHLAELGDLAREVEPLHGGDGVDDGGEAGHDAEIAPD